MSHPHDALLQAHLDGELEPSEMREVTRHLSTCEACRRASTELVEIGACFGEMVLQLDDVEPAEWHEPAPLPAGAGSAQRGVNGSQLMRRMRPRPALLERPAPVGVLAGWRWAAAALFLVTGVAAAAVVGGQLLHGPRQLPAGTTATEPAALALRAAGAIAVAPVHDAMVVALSDAITGSRLHVRITDAAELTVSVRTDSTSLEPARFRAGSERIAVQLPPAVSMVEVEIPATLGNVRVLVGDRVAASVDGGQVEPAAAATEGISLAPVR